MRQERFKEICDSLDYMTDEQLVELVDKIRTDANLRELGNNSQIHTLRAEADRLEEANSKLKESGISEPILLEGSVKRAAEPEQVDNTADTPKGFAAEDKKYSVIELFEEQGLKAGKSYRKAQLLKAIENIPYDYLYNNCFASEAFDKLVEEKVIVGNGKGWYRLEEGAGGCSD